MKGSENLKGLIHHSNRGVQYYFLIIIVRT